jgi:hypothetical protein
MNGSLVEYGLWCRYTFFELEAWIWKRVLRIVLFSTGKVNSAGIIS